MKLSDIAQQNGLDELDFKNFLLQYGYPVTTDILTNTDSLEDVYIRSAVRDYCAAASERLREQMEAEAALRELRSKYYKGFLFRIKGARGRILEVYNYKCIIQTKVTLGSVITGNASDGEKTIFYPDCTAIQFKLSGALIGYLQLETPSMQMNNTSSNFFSENTFTFDGSHQNGLNGLMSEVYYFVSELVGAAKYGHLDPEQVTIPESLQALLPPDAKNPFAED
jgi:hypothetical protein